MGLGRSPRHTPDRGTRARYLAVAAAVLAFILVVPASAERSDEGATGSEERIEDALRHQFDRPGIKEKLGRDATTLEQRQGQRQTAAARAERRDSRSKYSGLAQQDALEVARKHFGDVLRQAPYQALKLRDGEHVAEYRGDRAALVDAADGKKLLVQSTLPLRSTLGSGENRPVDLALEGRDGSFEPTNPLVPTRISKRLEDGISFEGHGYRVRLAAASSRARPDLIGGKLFFANALGEAADTDLIVSPTPTGAEVSLVVRSANAPESAALDLDLATGAQLRMVDEDPKTGAKEPEGAAEIVDGGERIALITPPAAWDVDGERIPVSYAVDGDRLELRFPHRDRDVHYPLYVDPIFDNFQINEYGQATGYDPDFGGWGPASNWSPPYPGYNWGRKSTYWGNGLTIRSDPAWYNAWAFYEVYFPAPPNTYIERADFGYVNHWSYYSCLIEGIYSWAKWDWDYGTWWDTGGGWGPSPWYYTVWGGAGDACTTQSYNYKAHIVGGYYPYWGAAYPDGRGVGDPEGTPGNGAVFGIYHPWTGYYGYTSYAFMYGASLWLYDDTVPQINSVSSPTGWVRGDTTITTTVTATDVGLGMLAFSLYPQGQAALGKWITPTGESVSSSAPPACTGAHYSRCPQTATTSFAYSTSTLPEGVSTTSGQAWDALSQPTTFSTQLKVDRSNPTVTLTGSLNDAAGNNVPAGSYQLTANASDPYSGVKSVEFYIDGVEQQAESETRSCDANSGCPSSAERSLTYDTNQRGLGTRTFKVVSQDPVGNARVDQYTVTFGPPPDFDECYDEVSNESTNVASNEDYCNMYNRDAAPAVDPNPPEDPVEPMDNPGPEECLAHYGVGSIFCNSLTPDFDLFGDDLLASASSASGSTTDTVRYGMADNGDHPATAEGWHDPRFAALKIKRVRAIVPYNVADYVEKDGSGNLVEVRQLKDFRHFYDEAVNRHQSIFVSFQRRADLPPKDPKRPDKQNQDYLPTLKDYVAKTRKFRSMFPLVKTYSAWNEPNHPDQPTRADHGGAKALALYTAGLMKSVCHDNCVVVAGELSQKRGWRDYLKAFRQRLLEKYNLSPARWAWHPYQDVKHREKFDSDTTIGSSDTHDFLTLIPGDSKVWFTEVGSRVDQDPCNKLTARRNTPESQAQEVSFLINRLSHQSSRIERLYYYQFREPNLGSPPNCHFDSGLIGTDYAPAPYNGTRPAYDVYKARVAP